MKKINCQFERKDERGIFREASNGPGWKSVNYGHMKKNSVMGNHYHKGCKALFMIIKGRAKIKVKNIKDENSPVNEIILQESEGIIIDEYETHAITFIDDSTWILLKSNEFDPANPDLHGHKLI